MKRALMKIPLAMFPKLLHLPPGVDVPHAHVDPYSPDEILIQLDGDGLPNSCLFPTDVTCPLKVLRPNYLHRADGHVDFIDWGEGPMNP
jgi:hypothetical protein